MILSLGRLLARLRCAGGRLLCLLIIAAPVSAQDLDPRAYANVPADVTLLISGFAVSHGDVLTDPTLPLRDVTPRQKPLHWEPHGRSASSAEPLRRLASCRTHGRRSQETFWAMR